MQEIGEETLSAVEARIWHIKERETRTAQQATVASYSRDGMCRYANRKRRKKICMFMLTEILYMSRVMIVTWQNVERLPDFMVEYWGGTYMTLLEHLLHRGSITPDIWWSPELLVTQSLVKAFPASMILITSYDEDNLSCCGGPAAFLLTSLYPVKCLWYWWFPMSVKESWS